MRMSLNTANNLTKVQRNILIAHKTINFEIFSFFTCIFVLAVKNENL